MLNLLGAVLTLAWPFGAGHLQTTKSPTMASWSSIGKKHPVAYFENAGALPNQPVFEFINVDSELIGEIGRPGLIGSIGFSKDRQLAAFIISRPNNSLDGYEGSIVVLDAKGNEARMDHSFPIGSILWTSDNSLAIIDSSVKAKKAFGSSISNPDQNLNIPVLEPLHPIDWFVTATGSGARAYAGFHNQFLGSIFIAPPPPGRGGFWMDASLNVTGSFLVGHKISALSTSSDGKFLAAVTEWGSGLKVLRTSDQREVFERRNDDVKFASWRDGRHEMAVGMDAQYDPASIWTFDLDSAVAHQFFLPAGVPVMSFWRNANSLLVEANLGKNQPNQLEILDMKTGVWTQTLTLPSGCALKSLDDAR